MFQEIPKILTQRENVKNIPKHHLKNVFFLFHKQLFHHIIIDSSLINEENKSHYLEFYETIFETINEILYPEFLEICVNLKQ